MIDISFWELAVVGVVGLVVLGPERLPKVARTAGHLFGRLQRYVATVKADLNREMEASDLAKMRQEVQEAARAFETSAQSEVTAIESEARAAAQTFEEAVKPADPALQAPAPGSQAAILAEQEADLAPRRPTPSLPPVAAPTPNTATFDFGIEPVRRRATP